MTDPCVLKGRSLLLRPYSLDDAAGVFDAGRESSKHIYPWMPWCHPAYAMSDSEGWVKFAMSAWERGEEYNFCMIDIASGRFLGGCGLNKLDKDYLSANLGYWVRASEVGKGVAVEAARLLASFALQTLNFNRVEIVAAVGNLASQKVAVRIGAVREGVARKRLRLHDVAHDAVVYSLIKEDLL